MTKARSEQGSALMMAIIILFIALAIGAALMATAISQKRESSNQQQSESAYSLAEAALNAQIYQLTLRWPTSKDAPQPSNSPNLGYPSSCTAASNGASYCPSSSDLAAAYPTSSGTCPGGTQGDAWSGSSSVTNGWTTYVRDASPGANSALFSDSAEQSALPFNSSVDQATNVGSVWVRSVGIVNCHEAVLITKVTNQIIGVTFPKFVLNANSFSTSNTGNKDIVNTGDTASNYQTSSAISLRCEGSAYGNGAQPPDSACAGISNPSQVEPSTSYVNPPAGSPTLCAGQPGYPCYNANVMQEVKNLAIENGTYYGPGNCNFPNPDQTGAANGGLAGQVVYIEGPCTISIPSNPVINGYANPGFLVVANGTFAFTGSATFYGVIYAPNLSGLTGDIVTLGGTSTVIGGLNVDGNAALNLGSSGNGAVNCTDTGFNNKCGDLEYDSAAFSGIQGFAGADPAPNTFRQLPNTQ
jgi:Tfp pilus assembly protein PilX